MAFLLSFLPACASDQASGPVVLVIQDGSAPDARDVVTPGVLGLELGLRGSGLGTRIVEAGELDPAAVVQDDDVVTAAIAPFTELPGSSVTALLDGGIPVVSLSSLSTRVSGSAPLRRFVAPLGAEADALAERASCAAGDGSAWSSALLAELPSLTVLEGGGAALATAVVRAGCDGVAWLGGADDGIVTLLQRTLPDGRVIVSSRARTPALATATPLGVDPRGSCPCVDPSTSVEPATQRFVHDYQAENGLEPGPFAVEGFDAGRLIGRNWRRGGDRDGAAAAFATTSRFAGLAGDYAWKEDGGLVEPSVRMYERVGLRWLEQAGTRVAGGSTQA